MSTNTNCEAEVKMYQFLQETRNNQPEFYDPIKRILRYMYKFVRKEYFDDEANDFFKVGEKDKGKNIIAAEKNMFKYYVQGEDGILDNLIKITKEKPECFFKSKAMNSKSCGVIIILSLKVYFAKYRYQMV